MSNIDPSAVKAGDTVTLLVDPPDTHPAFTVAGETHSLGGPTVYLGGWRVDDLPDYVTLTDHQPAPEPEPELPTRGTFGWADTVDGRRHGFVVGGANGSDYRAFRYYLPESDYSRATESFSTFVPDVVIDPAAVDVDALIDDALKSAQAKGYWPDTVVAGHMIRHVLAELGIEATS